MLSGVAKNLMLVRDFVKEEFCSGMDDICEPNLPSSDRTGRR